MDTLRMLKYATHGWPMTHVDGQCLAGIAHESPRLPVLPSVKGERRFPPREARGSPPRPRQPFRVPKP
eukprot:4245755-Karenia_brevis.AAC.1